MEAQIRSTFRTAFWDLLEEGIDGDLQVGWVTRHYMELPERLCRYLRPDGAFAAEIRASYDEAFFRQLLTHDAFDAVSAKSLIATTLGLVRQVQAPARDVELRRLEAELESELVSGTATFGKVFVRFLKGVHELLDTVDSDVRNLDRRTPPLR